MQRFHVRLTASLFAVLPLLTAQITTTSVRGTITDKTGAVVPNVEITATNTETNVARSVQSNADGQYTTEILPLGNYTIQASAAGFKRFVQTGILLELNQVARVDAVLELGNTSDAITVVGDAPTVRTAPVIVPLIGCVVVAFTVVCARFGSPLYVSVTCVGPDVGGAESVLGDSVVSWPVWPFSSLSSVVRSIESATPLEFT